ncbi:MAG: hypothetical protein C0175_00540 [Caldisericum exile]|uniref:DotA/TraY family protein n=1 Tax=Caldisericum exile TaxID=693075 RepID=A0A2J6X9M7_9BACT|nr:MAG: hypothetical protein C0175_00540 [Caldisericum exile]
MIRIMMILMMALLPSLSFAADSLFTAPDTDKSIQMICAMFGDMDLCKNSSSDVFDNVMLIFNSIILTVGGVLVAYTIFSGTLGTAHDGEMLGKKFSSVWIPIRFATGAALVLPVIGKGYCIMQYLVLWLTFQGVGLADTVWSSYLSANNTIKVATMDLEKPSVNQLAWNLFSSQTCLRAYEKITQDSNKESGMWGETPFGQTPVQSSSGTIIQFGATTQRNGFFNDSCGTLSIDNHEPISSTGIKFSLLSDLSEINANLSSIDSKHKVAVNQLISDIDKAAIAFVANPQTDVSSQVQAAAIAYQTAVKDAASPIVQKLGDLSKLEAESKKQGWALAGTHYINLVSLVDLAQRAMSKTPSASGVSGTINNNYKDQFQSKYLKPMLDLKSKNDGEFGVADSQETIAEQNQSWWKSAMSIFDYEKSLKKIFKLEILAIADTDEHPILVMKKVGSWAGVAAGGLFLKYGISMAALGVTQGSGTSLAIATLPIAMLIFPVLISIFVVLCYVLPMMPFLIFTGLVLGWLVLVVEAVVAAPLWAVMHLTASGDDMVGSGSQGYRLVLSLMLRPVLMIFGLIASFTILTVFGKFVNSIFFEAFAISQTSSNFLMTLIGALVLPLIYCGFMWSLMKKCFEIIHIIPDQILNWFGGAGQQLGSYGGALGGNGSSTYVAANAMAHMGGNALGGIRGMKDGAGGASGEGGKLGNAPVSGLKNSAPISKPETVKEPQVNESSSIVEKALAQNSENPDISSFEGQAISSKMDNANSSLGGETSSEGMKFNESMHADLDKGFAFNEAFSKNIETSLNDKFGEGSGKLLNQATGGKFEGDSFNRSVEQLKNVSSHYEKRGLVADEVKQKTSSLIQAASTSFETNSETRGDKTINDFVDKALSYSQQKDNAK